MKGNDYQEQAFLSRKEAFPLYLQSWKYDIVQTAMFEADTMALTTLVPMGLVPLGFVPKRGQIKLAVDTDTPVC